MLVRKFMGILSLKDTVQNNKSTSPHGRQVSVWLRKAFFCREQTGNEVVCVEGHGTSAFTTTSVETEVVGPAFLWDEGWGIHRGLEVTSGCLLTLRQEASFNWLFSIAVVSFRVAVEPESMSLLFWAGFKTVSLSVEEMEEGSRTKRQCDQIYGEYNSWKSVDLFLAGWHKDPLSPPGQGPGFSI